MRTLSYVFIAAMTLSSALGPQISDAGDCDEEKSKSRWRRCCCCFSLAEPPRGETAIAFAGRVNYESMFDREMETKTKAEAAQEEANDRIDTLEEDLTRLTKIVEKMAESQSQIDQDLTRLTTLIEKIDAQTK